MSYGMGCHDICPKADMDTIFDAVRDLGIHQTQLAFGKSIVGLDFSCGHYPSGLGRMVAEKLRERGTHAAVLGCYINSTNSDETKRQTKMQKFIEYLKHAKAIGAGVVGMETGRYDANFRVVPETCTEECYRLLLKSMREIAAAAEKLGVTAGVESVHDHTLYNLQIVRRFLEDVGSPNVEIILDPANPTGKDEVESQAQVTDEALCLYGDRVIMVHVKDFTRDNGRLRSAHMGDGLFDCAPLLKHLKEREPYITVLLGNSAAERHHRDVGYLRKIYKNIQLVTGREAHDIKRRSAAGAL